MFLCGINEKSGIQAFFLPLIGTCFVCIYIFLYFDIVKALDMNRTILFLICILFTLMTGCSEKTGIKNSIPGIYKDAPEWVLDSEFSDSVSGSGMAMINGDYDEAYNEAVDNAKSELYSRLSKKIRSCMSDIFKKNSSLENEAFARIGASIAQTASSGFKAKDLWRSPDNEIFVLVVSDVDVIRDALKKKLVDFLNIRKPEGFDPESPKIREDLDKYANMHFRYFRPL